jgi:hypothetical protein
MVLSRASLDLFVSPVRPRKRGGRFSVIVRRRCRDGATSGAVFLTVPDALVPRHFGHGRAQ